MLRQPVSNLNARFLACQGHMRGQVLHHELVEWTFVPVGNSLTDDNSEEELVDQTEARNTEEKAKSTKEDGVFLHLSFASFASDTLTRNDRQTATRRDKLS